jgi:ABC-type dipeptide/oligopeptide/nickel transport system permease subunit
MATLEIDAEIAPRRPGTWRRLVTDPTGLIAGGFVALVVVSAIFAPWIAGHDPYETNLANIMKPPGAEHLFGTDGQGRDIFARTLFGFRLTLLIGLVAVVVGGGLGAVLGILAAYYRVLDGVIMRVMDMLLSFPAILFGLAIAAIFGPGVIAVIVAMAVATIPQMARIARAGAFTVLKLDYMEAGRAIGLGDGALIWRYLGANCLSPMVVFATLRLGQVILLASALSFLGLGAQPPAAELGTMAAQGRDFLFIAPHIASIPSAAIFLIVLAFNLLGDALRDATDPRLRR